MNNEEQNQNNAEQNGDQSWVSNNGFFGQGRGPGPGLTRTPSQHPDLDTPNGP